MRQAAARLHRWLGLAAAVWLFVLALTGAACAFYAEGDRLIAPGYFAATAGPPVPLAQVAAAAEAAWPGARVRSIDLPTAPGEPAIARLTGEVGSGPTWREASVDPATGRLLGRRIWGAPRLDALHLMPLVYRIHHDLLMGDWVEPVLGALALAWVVTQLLALRLALPSRRRWRQSFTVHGSTAYARRFRWHRALGLWMLPVTLMMAVTGGSFHLGDLYRRAVGASPGGPPAGLAQRVAPGGAAIGWDRALAIGGPAVQRIGYDPRRGLYALRLRDPRDAGAKAQRDLMVDAATGHILVNRHRRDGSAGDAFMAWQYPLHSGEVLGLAGKLLVMATGLGTATLVVLGVRVWLRRTGVARRKARDHKPIAQALQSLQPVG